MSREETVYKQAKVVCQGTLSETKLEDHRDTLICLEDRTGRSLSVFFRNLVDFLVNYMFFHCDTISSCVVLFCQTKSI